MNRSTSKFKYHKILKSIRLIESTFFIIQLMNIFDGNK